MENLILFLNSFFSYILLLLAMVVLMIAGAVIGIKWRKSKDAKAATEAEQTADKTSAV